MLWGALNNATQAMMATSWQMGSISQNIANVNTVGYKHKETLFKTLLSESKAAPMTATSGLNIFTVQAADRTHITSQGMVTPTDHWSDLAINGRGFFMVASPTDTGTPPTNPNAANAEDVQYTRAGTFHQIARPDGRSYFVTSGGQHLLGWQADANGVVSEGGSLQAVYTEPETVMPGQATTTASLLANLPSNTAMGASAYASSNIAMADGTGVADTAQMQLQWTRVDGNTWTVTPGFPGGEGAVTSGSFTVTRDAWGNISQVAPPLPATIDITWAAGHFGAPGTEIGTYNLASLAGFSPPTPHMEKIQLPVFDSALNAQTVALSFERTGTNTWYMHVPGATSEPVEIRFDADGQLVSPQNTAVNMTFTEAGPPPVTTTAAVTVDLSKLSQYKDSGLYIGTVDQNGYGDGRMRYARFSPEGELEATFDNGQSRILFKVPVATFVSENNLEPISGTLFRRSLAAGDITVSGIDSLSDGGGYITSSAVENSTVAIEDEFTKMIMTQKAYSTNATVFKTADEMTTVARDLK